MARIESKKRDLDVKLDLLNLKLSKPVIGIVYFFVGSDEGIPKLIKDLNERARKNAKIGPYPINPITEVKLEIDKPEVDVNPINFYLDFINQINARHQQDSIVVSNMEDYLFSRGLRDYPELDPTKNRGKIVYDISRVVFNAYREKIHEMLTKPIGLIFTRNSGAYDFLLHGENDSGFSTKLGVAFFEEVY